MNFISVLVRQAVEGNPGFVEDDEFVINIAVDKITVFNQGVDDEGKDVIFVRMVCGASICVVCDFEEFIELLANA